MAAEIFTDLSRASDSNLTPYPGAKWYFYEQGSLTPLAVYTSAALTTPHTNPVIADSGGKFPPIYFDATKSYRGILKDLDDSVTIYDIDPINAGVIRQLSQDTGAQLIGFKQAGTGSVARTLEAKVRDVVSALDFGAVGDGVANDTAALQAAIDYVSDNGLTLRIPGGTYLVSTLNLTGSGYAIETAQGVVFQQVAGTSDGSSLRPILKFDSAQSVRLGDCHFIGAISGDTGEYNHAIAILSSKFLKLGAISGEDIRGDVVYTYGRSSSYAEMTLGVEIESIRGDNILRCILATAGGQVRVGAVIAEGGVGYRDFDMEPNAEPDYQPCDVYIGYLRGSRVQCVSADDSLFNYRLEIGMLDLDAARLIDCSPSYQGLSLTNSFALQYSHCLWGRIHHFRARDYAYYPVHLTAGTGNKSNLSIGICDFANCDNGETTYNTQFYAPGTDPVGLLDIDYLLVSLPAGQKYVFRGDTTPLNVRVKAGSVTGGGLTISAMGEISNVDVDAGNSAGFVVLTSDRLRLRGIRVTNAASTTFIRQSSRITLEDVEGTFGTALTVNSNRIKAINTSINGVYYLDEYIGSNNQNKSGSVTFSSSTTATVTFPTAEADASYRVILGGGANKTFWVSSKSTSGFTVNASASSSDTVDWQICR